MQTTVKQFKERFLDISGSIGMISDELYNLSIEENPLSIDPAVFSWTNLLATEAYHSTPFESLSDEDFTAKFISSEMLEKLQQFALTLKHAGKNILCDMFTNMCKSLYKEDWNVENNVKEIKNENTSQQPNLSTFPFWNNNNQTITSKVESITQNEPFHIDQVVSKNFVVNLSKKYETALNYLDKQIQAIAQNKKKYS